MFTLHPVTPSIGAEVADIDLSHSLTTDVLNALKEALWKHQVLFFREQTFDDENFVSFGKRWGQLTEHPVGNKRHPTYRELTNVRADENSRSVFGEFWHSDQASLAVPPALSMLYIRVLPSVGGDTLWASMYAAYDALSKPMQHLLGGLTLFHNGLKPNRGYVMAPEIKMHHNEHPLVIRHPHSRRAALFVNRASATHIPQLRWPESEALLAYLYSHVEQVQFQCRFRWQANSIALWDNRCTIHNAIWDYYPQTREGVRLTVDGEQLLAFEPDRAVYSNEVVQRQSLA